MRLKDRRILITGAASGIGKATAELFAREGAKLALLDRDEAGLKPIAASTKGIVCVGDLTNEAGLKAAIDKAGEALGGLDGLVNSAGIVIASRLGEGSTDDWRKVIEINLVGTYLACRFALPWLEKSERATIVNLASGQALLPAPCNGAYAASKAGVVGLTKVLAQELAPKIRVNAVAPGTIETPMGMRAMKLTDENAVKRRADVAAAYALKRIGMPEEIAQVLLFLSSDESSFVTGATLAADGGRTFH